MTAPRPHAILLCSLGASWAVIPEVFGWLAPDKLDLYAYHPRAGDLARARAAHGLASPDELWVCTTEGAQAGTSLSRMLDWWRSLGEPVPLRIWRAGGTDQLAGDAECARMRELTLRLALMAAEVVGPGGQWVASLAGGRKTMSADMQEAGQTMGAAAMLHVVGPEPLPAALKMDPQPPLFTRPLDAALAAAVQPLIVGAGARSDVLDIEVAGKRVEARHFPLPLATPGAPLAWAPRPGEESLNDELARRRRESQKLWGNFLASLDAGESHEPWGSLYRLDPRAIARLRGERLGPEHRDWLTALPKADLHRHLGGCLDLAAQRAVAQSIWSAANGAERDAAMRRVRPLLDGREDWPWDWPGTLQSSRDARARAHAGAALLLNVEDARLERNLYGVTEPRAALKEHPQGGFERYERPGELTGSAQLADPAAIEPYASALVAQARAEGLAYVELRGSPHKYRGEAPGEFINDLERALARAGARTADSPNAAESDHPRFAFLWIADRRQSNTMALVADAAVAAHARLPSFVLGIDLAGDEGVHAPAELAREFAPAFEACLRVTIHAGEGESARNIWEAAYHLHADRVGHGLSLGEHAELAQRFRDRGIALELCPTSNREVVGYRDPALEATVRMPAYPLRRFLRAGLPVTLCTDNPGVSRTTLAGEYLAAARMCEDGLTLWEVLALVRQGFTHAFLPAAERDRLRRTAERRVFAAALARQGH
jgi:adenosine deaminase